MTASMTLALRPSRWFLNCLHIRPNDLLTAAPQAAWSIMKWTEPAWNIGSGNSCIVMTNKPLLLRCHDLRSRRVTPASGEETRPGYGSSLHFSGKGVHSSLGTQERPGSPSLRRDSPGHIEARSGRSEVTPWAGPDDFPWRDAAGSVECDLPWRFETGRGP